jgi:imidazolonepropionase-like amidohydrolase
MTLVARRLFDSSTASHKEDQAVRIESGRVVWTGARPELPQDTDVIDLGEATILPGLIDAHVHLGWDPWANAQEERPSTRRVSAEAMRNAARQLDHGVTAVRDLGAPAGGVLAITSALEAEPAAGPTVVAAGMAVGAPGGHAPSIARPAQGADAVAEAVEGEIEAGAGVVKLMATGGVLGAGEDPDDIQLDDEELRAAVEVAHSAGLRVAVHAHARGAIAAAVAAGVDSVEHGSRLDAPTAALMAARGVSLVPTIAPLKRVCEFGAEEGVPAHVLAKAPAALEGVREAFVLARAAGVDLVPGTDAGVPATEHGSLLREIEAFAEAGMAIADCLAAATLGGARLLVLGDRGRIARGTHADLVVLDGDPLLGLGVLEVPRAVIRSGVVVRGSLAAA